VQIIDKWIEVDAVHDTPPVIAPIVGPSA